MNKINLEIFLIGVLMVALSGISYGQVPVSHWEMLEKIPKDERITSENCEAREGDEEEILARCQWDGSRPFFRIDRCGYLGGSDKRCTIKITYTKKLPT